MSRFDSPLKNLQVASPCSVDWDSMYGDDRKRFCGQCKLNVFNLSGMSTDEAENLIMNAEGRLCVRFYQRSDGTVLTADCPVGLARVKQRMRATMTAAASLSSVKIWRGCVACPVGRCKSAARPGSRFMRA